MKYILGNWKMNGTRASAKALADAVAAFEGGSGAVVALFPPATLMPLVQASLGPSRVGLGAQDVSAEANGAFTGDISAGMLKEAGCRYVIVGHSERRAGHAETDEIVKKKAEAVLAAGMKPVICVGENLTQREAGEHLAVVKAQLEKSLPDAKGAQFLVAYEPVWAIGSGLTPTLQQIEEVHKTIASVLSYATSGAGKAAPAPAILYGGSVKGSNAGEIMAVPGVDGVLVGGASLKAEEFCAIIAAARS